MIGFAPTTAGDYGGTITVNGNQTAGINTVAVSGAAYPNMNGAWAGTSTASAVGQSGVCNMTWIAAGQTGTEFSGTWQNSGSLCGQAGTFSGTVSTSNAVTGVSFIATVGASNCTRIAGDGLFSGVVTGTNATLKSTDTIRCPGLGDLSRSRTLSMRKQ
jgi:hypothetical protein